jgi:hypothetical protein
MEEIRNAHILVERSEEAPALTPSARRSDKGLSDALKLKN